MAGIVAQLFDAAHAARPTEGPPNDHRRPRPPSSRSRPDGCAASGAASPAPPGASAAFLGIPFAQAPVGDLRFAAPVPPEPWEGIRDALEYGATAQRGDPGITLIPEPSVPGESTLNVNVFTPAPGETDAALPVLVYIHGGGYTAGSPASPWYDGRAFNRDGVVTVSVSYRLGFDGFGHIPGAPSNRGVRDWIAALEWVRDNIAAFGGDPSRVTIAGQSAGGGAVLTLLGMPAAQHLFHCRVGALRRARRRRRRARADALGPAREPRRRRRRPARDSRRCPRSGCSNCRRRRARPRAATRMAGVRAFLRRGPAVGAGDRRRPDPPVDAGRRCAPASAPTSRSCSARRTTSSR